MKAIVWGPGIGCALLLTIGASPAHAQAEVTPFVSIGSVNSPQVGAAIRFAWTSKLSLEVEASYRHANIDTFNTSVNLLYDLPRIGRAIPYVVGGVGLEQFGTVVEQPFGLAVQRNVALAFNAGAGVRVPVTEKWGYRGDVRWSNALGRWGPESWRVYNGVTFGGTK
jgi:opacity protein-like surface antigen